MSGARLLRSWAPAGALVFALALAGCARQKFEPLREDSTAVIRPDSFAVALKGAADAWDAGQNERAAELTARAVAADLAARGLESRPEEWQARAAAMLDSLGFGAEAAARDGALLLNLFSRANPEAGSWPWLLVRAPGGLDCQPVEGSGLRLVSLASRGLVALAKAPADAKAGAKPAAAAPGPAPGVAALWSRRAALGTQPLVTVWRRGAKGRWEIAQSLGADSLGRFGTGEFSSADSTVELVVRSYGPTARFEECATCPHLYTVRRFVWGEGGFTRVEERSLPSPYATFVRFVTAIAVGDAEMAQSLCTSPQWADEARRLEFGLSRGVWRVAPATDESAREMTFLRGKQEAYRVSFSQLGDAWLVDGITPTTGAIE